MYLMQVSKEHYSFEKYTDIPRWISYWHQINEALKLKPNSVLVIGPGDGVVVNYLKKHIEEVKTFDIALDLNPDIQGSVLDLSKCIDKKFDLIICCQVLEHLPFEDFEKVLNQIKLHSRHFILSLPYAQTNLFEIFIRLPKKLSFYFNLVLPKLYKKWTFDGEHYWEVGTKNHSKTKILNIINKFFEVKKTYHVRFNKYHLFYICES